ncbi:hypothetical protein C8R44DRAFT_791242 [Mycena epipterygia]|nr:hypothetical protein C8R44DRAFT_791242 [Mycena epipterygia]
MSTDGGALADMTNVQLDPLTQALEALAKTQADLDNMKSLVAGFTTKQKKTGRRKRKPSADLDNEAENNAPPTNKAKKTSDTSQNFESHGRMIMRFIGPFESLENIINHGLKGDTALLGDEVEESNEGKRLTESWSILWQKFPGFHELMLTIHKELLLIQTIARQMNTGMESARADDTGTVKPRILSWTAEDATTTAMTASSSKVTRGFADPVTGMLLLPLEYKDKEEYPNPLGMILAGDLDINGLQFPCFLFPLGQADDVLALDTILSGPLMLRTAKALLMGPSSALQGDGWHQGRPGNASIIGLKTFTDRVICYIVCQVRANLSNQNQWNKMDGHFDYEQFFWHLVDLFKDEAFASKMIALYNRVVLGRASGIAPAPTTGGSAAPALTHFQRLQAARAAAASTV